MDYVVIGLNFKTAPVEVREAIHFHEKKLDELVPQLLDETGAKEGMLVSTCNRTEVYLATTKDEDIKSKVQYFLEKASGIERERFQKMLYFYEGNEAIEHIFRVTASLDSMIVGEVQVTGQVKDAFRRAKDAGGVDTYMDRLMSRAFAAAKQVRTDTAISESAVSIPFAAIELARKIFSDLAKLTVMVIGAGEMGELTLRHLVSNGASRVIVISHREGQGQSLKEEFHAEVYPYSRIDEYLHKADIVISSTGSQEPVINKQMVGRALKKRKNVPMFLIDIAVPRDIEDRVNTLDNAYLYNIDDLAQVVAYNKRLREKEAQKAEPIILGEVACFRAWLNSLKVKPVISALHQKCEDIRKAELEKTISKLDGLDEAQIDRLEAATQAIVKKILHDPVVMLRELSENGDENVLAEAISRLFKLDTWKGEE